MIEQTAIRMVRQGDVLLKRVESPAYPLNPKPTRIKPEQGRVILGRGEATGHHHSLVADDDTELVTLGDKMLLTLVRGSTLSHQEHAPIELPGGTYEVVPQREYVPTPAGMPTRWSRVRD